MATIARGESFMLKAKKIKVSVIDNSNNGCKLMISIVNKLGEFIIYSGKHGPLSKGQNIEIDCDKNFKLKTRIDID